jgi:hypothetical protein
MFVIPNMYVEDKHLAKVLSALAGLVISMEVPRPVINAVVHKGKIKQAVATNGSGDTIISLVKDKVASFAKGTELPVSQIRTIIHDSGGTSGTSGYYTNQMKIQKIIKLKQRGTWVVL